MLVDYTPNSGRLKTMRNYELTLLFSPILSEEEVNNTVQQIAATIQDKGGMLGRQDVKGKKPLLAPIKRHKEAYLGILGFSLSEDQALQIEKVLEERNGLLRSMLLYVPARKKPAVPHFAKVAAERIPEPIAEQPKVETEDIDKQLEEIFKDESK